MGVEASSADLKREAERFRGLAAHIGDAETKARLFRMADDFDRWADPDREDPTLAGDPAIGPHGET